jgi:hypothetical protein
MQDFLQKTIEAGLRGEKWAKVSWNPFAK